MHTADLERKTVEVESALREPFDVDAPPFMCESRSIDFDTTRLEDIIAVYGSLKDAINAMLEASHQYDRLGVLETTYDVRL